ncbi:hypothetical protein [Mycobacterium hackensackense]|uniref:hypothetical protein n=1 Tax=Mycobacterium hackensackense TaxID=228909 RepID=UPI0022659FAC|nr:hypothetical protein [Mycobacterium hackensackense]
MRTLYNQVLPRLALASGALAANATANGATIDLGVFKNNFRTALFVVTAGTVTDGTHTVRLQHSDNGTDWTDVPADRVQGGPVVFDNTKSDSVAQLGYIVQQQRYVRLKVTSATVTTGGVFSALALLAAGSTTPPARA